MMNEIKDFVSEKTHNLAEKAQKLRKEPAKAAREAALKAADRMKSLKDPVRALTRSRQKMAAIRQGTAQSLIELQAEIVTNALDAAARRLERAARTENLRELVREQRDVLGAAREKIVADIGQAVSIFKEAGGDLRKVAKQAYANVSGKEEPKPAAAKTGRARKAKRAVRKTTARARKTA